MAQSGSEIVTLSTIGKEGFVSHGWQKISWQNAIHVSHTLIFRFLNVRIPVEGAVTSSRLKSKDPNLQVALTHFSFCERI